MNNKISVTQWKNIVSLILAHMEADNIPNDRLFVTPPTSLTVNSTFDDYQSVFDNYNYHTSPCLSFRNNLIYCTNNSLNHYAQISYDNACLIANNFFNEQGSSFSIQLINDATNQNIN